MTTLDRAFIKAFDDAQGAGRTIPLALERKTIRPDRGLETRANLGARPDQAATVVGPAAPHTVASFAPLSSFAPPTRSDETLRPLLEVDRLAWPEICDKLLHGSRALWETFATILAERIASDCKCIALTSTRRGVGRTTVALALAKLMSIRGLRPLVVDADFDNPALAMACGVSPTVGWGEVIERELPLGEALISAVEDGVTLMPWQGPLRRLTDGHSLERVGDCFRQLHENYDLIILDAMTVPGPKAVAEMAALASATAPCQIYFIRDVRTMAVSQVEDSCRRLQVATLEVAGVIENFSAQNQG
jgi:Mrp family chromosome partitioning ATPase